MYTCASCTLKSCSDPEHQVLPKNCPMHDTQLMDMAFLEYGTEENHSFYVSSSEIEALGYCRWPRAKEIMEFCKTMGYNRIGIAFCRGLRKEAEIFDAIIRNAGFTTVSVICKAGGIPKERAGIKRERKVRPESFEPMCNPIAQAMLLNRQDTQFNIAVGLCVGHDSLFFRYSKAPVTVLIAKDRVLAHNPAGALYCAEGYFKDRL